MEQYWHTTAHILAQAVKRLYPGTMLAIGPAIETGFYYDFDFEKPITPDDLPVIEAEMKKIIKQSLDIEHFTLPRDKALELTRSLGEHYKTELIEDLPSETEFSFYKQGEFVDLCKGPHKPNTRFIGHVKLLSVAGAYWRGNEKNKMLTRVYGVSFPTKAELDEYVAEIEEAKKRDHRKLGLELKLFTFFEEGPGFPFFLPNGMIIKNELINFWREIHNKAEYHEINTPIILDIAMWQRSGHLEHYAENMYTTEIDETDFAVKPMNCPGAMLVYGSDMRSYRDLPLRFAELGLVHRHEKSGALHGLMRVRSFTQDDAHIFMTPDQIKSEIKGVIARVEKIYSAFGFTYTIELSTRPEKSMGKDEDWDAATVALREALEESGKEFKINEGDGAFYGPKIDFHLRDSIGRTWQCGTIQLDFQMPERFLLSYIGSDGGKHRPIMIHHAILGSIERFIGVLTEHFAGSFPIWLAPTQVIVLPISEKYGEYGNTVYNKLIDLNIRAQIDTRPEKIGYKIREARNMRIPYIFVAGEKEKESGTVSVRSRAGDEGEMNTSEIIKRISEEISRR